MDLGGMVTMEDCLVGAYSEGGSLPACFLATPSSEACRAKGGLQRLGRAAEPDDCDWRSLKMSRTEPVVPNPHSLFPDGERMLSFSSAPRQDSALVLGCDEALPYYCPPSASSSSTPYLRNAGSYPGSTDVNMNGVLARVRGPFTPSQWLELELQALIYKYFVAKVPIPPSLLIPIRRGLASSGFPFSAGSFGSSALGWGSLYLGYSGNSDPEPGRCRRTDGKKWRCSRDAVADQKYCERHMNRGRHRSRKHVEGQSGNTVKTTPVAASPQSATPVTGGGSSSSPRIAQPSSTTIQPNVGEARTIPFNMTMVNKKNMNHQGQNPVSLSMLTSMEQKPINALFSISKQQTEDFGLVSSVSHLNPSSSSFSDNYFIPSPKLESLQAQSHPLHHFIDDWPKPQAGHSTVSWPGIEEMQLERTQLSMSIPVASSEFSSSSPNHENTTVSPVTLSQEFEVAHMDSRIRMPNEVNQRQASWIPISWETSVGGPLGEALNNTSSTPKDQSKNFSSSSRNLLTEGWELSPRLDSSPTGVLQKTTFGSLTSSTGSSPRAENRNGHERTGSLCDDLLGPTLE